MLARCQDAWWYVRPVTGPLSHLVVISWQRWDDLLGHWVSKVFFFPLETSLKSQWVKSVTHCSLVVFIKLKIDTSDTLLFILRARTGSHRMSLSWEGGQRYNNVSSSTKCQTLKNCLNVTHWTSSKVTYIKKNCGLIKWETSKGYFEVKQKNKKNNSNYKVLHVII